MKQNLLQAIVALSLCVSAAAQVNSGSNGSDGAPDYSAAGERAVSWLDARPHPGLLPQGEGELFAALWRCGHTRLAHDFFANNWKAATTPATNHHAERSDAVPSPGGEG